MRAPVPGWDQLTTWESLFWARSQTVGGVDEVGRGPLAGPVVAAYVRLSPTTPIKGLWDSKALGPSQRNRLADAILGSAVAFGVGFVGPRTIERVNIVRASRLAMRLAVGHAAEIPSILLTDAMQVGGPWQEWCFIKGDQRSASIAAASILAKVMRDRYMQQLAEQYPGYGFDQNKGYPTISHRRALQYLGPCEAHRRSFLS